MCALSPAVPTKSYPPFYEQDAITQTYTEKQLQDSSENHFKKHAARLNFSDNLREDFYFDTKKWVLPLET